MILHLKTPSRRLIITIFWIVITSLTVAWVITGGGLEAWIFLIGEIIFPFALWIQSKLTDNHSPSEVQAKSRQYLMSLQERLQKDPGIRNFVPLHIQKNPDQPQIKTIADAYDQLNHFVIVGKAGTGKTTLLSWLALQTVSKSLDNGELLQTVVWLDLSEWADTENLESFVQRQWIQVDKPFEAISQQNSIVFFDGLDELGPKSEKKLKQIENWLQRPIRCIATCRAENFANLNLMLPTVELAPQLTNLQICQFAYQYLEDGAEQFLALMMMDISDCYEAAGSQKNIDVNSVAHTPTYTNKLHTFIDTYFDLEELRTLCFELGVDFDNLRSEGKANKARELILLLKRNERLPELVDEISRAKPHITLSDTTPPQSQKNLAEKLQDISERYFNGKDLKLLIKIITETQGRHTHKWGYLKNIYQPFINTPFQIAILFQHYNEYIHRGVLPLNLGRVTDDIVRAICYREQSRRSSHWISYPALTSLLSEFAYSINSYSYESDCQTGEGRHLLQAAYELNSAFDRIKYNQQSRLKKSLSIGSKLFSVPIGIFFFLLIIPLKLIGNFISRNIIQRFRPFRPIANKLYTYDRSQIEKSRQKAIQQAQPILESLESAGLLQIIKEPEVYTNKPLKCVHFSQKVYLDYFTAHAFLGSHPPPIFAKRRYQTGWRRMSGYWDRVFIALSGLIGDPEALISELASIHKNTKEYRDKYGIDESDEDHEKEEYVYNKGEPNDLYLAAKCIISLGGNTIEPAFRNKLAACLVTTMHNIRSAGEQRSVDYARAIYFIEYSGKPSDMTATIAALQPYDFHQEAIREVVVLYGKERHYQKAIVDSLLDELTLRLKDENDDSANRKTAQSIIRTLGQIGHPSALQPLQRLLSKVNTSDKTLYGPLLVALARLGDQQAEAKFLKFLVTGDGREIRDRFQAWQDAADLNIAVVPKLIDLLYRHNNPSKGFIRTISMFGRPATPILIQHLEYSKNKPSSDPIVPYVQATLIEALAKLGDVRALAVIQTFLDGPDTIHNTYALCSLINSLAEEIGNNSVFVSIRTFLSELDLVSDSAAIELFHYSLSEIDNDQIQKLVNKQSAGSSYSSQEMAIFIQALMETNDRFVREAIRTYLDRIDLVSNSVALNNFIYDLSFINDERISPLLQTYYKDITSPACEAAINAVGLFPEYFDAMSLIPLLSSKSPIVRSLTAGTLGKLGDERAARPLARLLDDYAKIPRQYGFGNAELVREFAKEALLAINTPDSRALLAMTYGRA